MSAAKPQSPAGTVEEPLADAPLSVRLVDPSLFTAPYDGALTIGLQAAGVQLRWAVRPLRPGDVAELPADCVDDWFYRRAERLERLPGRLRALAKGVEHAWGMAQLYWRVRTENPDVVHLQWVVLPLLDVPVLARLKRHAALVITVHDTVPFNGERISRLQVAGFDRPLHLADALIVHTRGARETLIARGLPAERIHVVPHGPLALRCQPTASIGPRDPRTTVVAFGEIKPYKGVDVLLDALGQLDVAVRQRLRVIVAGRPRMPMQGLLDQTRRLGLESVVDYRLKRLSDQEVADLFDEADAFVFPYRQIDASGVYYLSLQTGKPLIASRVGVFAEGLACVEGHHLVPTADPKALAMVLEGLTGARPRPLVDVPEAAGWEQIGRRTAIVYATAVRVSTAGGKRGGGEQ